MEKSLWSIEGVPIKMNLSESENQCPYQNEWNWWEMNELRWIEVNRGEMSEWMEMTWNNPMRKSLWVENECPYRSDLNDLNEKVPIKMNGFNEKWVNRVNRTIWDEMSELKDLTLWTLWESPYGR